MMQTLWGLLVAHALTDYALQSKAMGELKNPCFQEVAGFPRNLYGPWWWHMVAHGLINGGGVALVTHSWTFGVAETIVHSLLDYMKCRRLLTTTQDQAWHVASKCCWAFFAQ